MCTKKHILVCTCRLSVEGAAENNEAAKPDVGEAGEGGSVWGVGGSVKGDCLAASAAALLAVRDGGLTATEIAFLVVLNDVELQSLVL